MLASAFAATGLVVIVAVGWLGYNLWPMMRQGLHLTGEES